MGKHELKTKILVYLSLADTWCQDHLINYMVFNQCYLINQFLTSIHYLNCFNYPLNEHPCGGEDLLTASLQA